MDASFVVATSPDVVCSDLIESGILLDLNSKQYFSLNSTGLLVWKILDERGSLPALESELGSSYPGWTGGDPFGIQRFVASLTSYGLLLPDLEGGASLSSSNYRLPSDWVSPEVVPHGKPLSEVILSPFDPTVPIPE